MLSNKSERTMPSVVSTAIDEAPIRRTRTHPSTALRARKAGAMGLKLYAHLDSMSVRLLTAAAPRAGMPVWGHAWVQPTSVMEQSTAGMDGLLYGKGHFKIGDDEAAILEFRPPECRYWSFQIMNDFWETQEFDLRQTSLNGHQGRLDPDGVFRGVIAVNDPGVPNWLDPVGHGNGLICARVLYPKSTPEVTIRTVPLTRGELGLLQAFLRAPQQVLSREQLLAASRLHAEEVYDRSIDVQILRLRRKLEPDPSNPTLIRTERGIGYVFAAAAEAG